MVAAIEPTMLKDLNLVVLRYFQDKTSSLNYRGFCSYIATKKENMESIRGLKKKDSFAL